MMNAGGHRMGLGGSSPWIGLSPAWLEMVSAIVFATVVLSHLRHMAQTDGQRRPWHACHVLMALSMICMYLPVLATHPAVGLACRVTLAAAGLLAAGWAIWGASGSVNPVWLLTALDLGVMLYMWSGTPSGATAAGAAAVLLVYLMANAGLWTLDAHRCLEREPWLMRWLPAGDPRGQAVALPVGAGRASALLGDLDISASMVLMSLGMAYMVLLTV